MSRPTAATKALELLGDTRRVKAVELKLAGWSWVRIAKELDYPDQWAAWRDVTEALTARRKELALSLDLLREQEAAHLEALRARVWQVMTRRHVLVSGGKVVTHVVDGVVVELVDDGPVLAAVDRLVRIQQRLSELLGLDMPKEMVITSYGYTVNGVSIELVQ